MWWWWWWWWCRSGRWGAERGERREARWRSGGGTEEVEGRWWSVVTELVTRTETQELVMSCDRAGTTEEAGRLTIEQRFVINESLTRRRKK